MSDDEYADGVNTSDSEDSVAQVAAQQARRRVQIKLGAKGVGAKSGNIVCHVCGKAGHNAGFIGSIYVDCPNKPCYLCKRVGHTTQTCPFRVQPHHGASASAAAGPTSAASAGGAVGRGRHGLSRIPMHRLPAVRASIAADPESAVGIDTSYADIAASTCVPRDWRVDAAVLRLHNRRISALLFPANHHWEGRLITGDKSGEIGVWRYQGDRKDRFIYGGHRYLVSALDIDHRDCKVLWSCSHDGTVRLQRPEMRTHDELLNLNPRGWTGNEKEWRMFYSLAVPNSGADGGSSGGSYVPVLAGDDQGRIWGLDPRGPGIGTSISSSTTTSSGIGVGAGDAHAAASGFSSSTSTSAAGSYASKAGGVLGYWQAHKKGNKVYSVHHNPAMPCLVVSAGGDWNVQLWDVRMASWVHDPDQFAASGTFTQAAGAAAAGPAMSQSAAFDHFEDGLHGGGGYEEDQTLSLSSPLRPSTSAATSPSPIVRPWNPSRAQVLSSTAWGYPPSPRASSPLAAGVAGSAGSASPAAAAVSSSSSSSGGKKGRKSVGASGSGYCSGYGAGAGSASSTSSGHKGSQGPLLAALPHPRVVNSAVFSPHTGNGLLTTCIDNRIRVWHNVASLFGMGPSSSSSNSSSADGAGDGGQSGLRPDRELVHSHDFARYLQPFRAVYYIPDATERTIVCGRYISESFTPANKEAGDIKLHPVDILDCHGGGRGLRDSRQNPSGTLAQLVDPVMATIGPVNAVHPTKPIIATGSSRSLYLWQPRPKDDRGWMARAAADDGDSQDNESDDTESDEDDDDGDGGGGRRAQGAGAGSGSSKRRPNGSPSTASASLPKSTKGKQKSGGDGAGGAGGDDDWIADVAAEYRAALLEGPGQDYGRGAGTEPVNDDNDNDGDGGGGSSKKKPTKAKASSASKSAGAGTSGGSAGKGKKGSGRKRKDEDDDEDYDAGDGGDHGGGGGGKKRKK